MRKLILIFLLVPFACKAQDQNVISTEVILINAVLENTAKYLKNKNQKEINPLELNTHKRILSTGTSPHLTSGKL